MELNLNKVLDDIKGWIYEVGKYQKEKIHDNLKYSTKSTDTDIVTEVDKYSNEFLVSRIISIYNDHSILSEEQEEIVNDSEYKWIIDPLDGTNNYFHKFPIYSISIALQKNSETILGVIYIPSLKELFYAIKDRGAYLNDKPIKVSDAKQLNQSILTTGFPYDKHISLHNNINIFAKILPKSQCCRRTGSSAFDLCSVACGRIDGYWELKLSKWDIAAGEFIIREAGGRVYISHLKKENGEDGFNVICGNEIIANKIKDQVNLVYLYF